MISRHGNYYTQCKQLFAKVILTVQEVHVPVRKNMQKSRIVSFNNSFRGIIEYQFQFHACDEERNGFQKYSCLITS